MLSYAIRTSWWPFILMPVQCQPKLKHRGLRGLLNVSEWLGDTTRSKIHIAHLLALFLPTQLLWFEIPGNNFHRHSPMHLSQVRPQSTDEQCKNQMNCVKSYRILEVDLAGWDFLPLHFISFTPILNPYLYLLRRADVWKNNKGTKCLLT